MKILTLISIVILGSLLSSTIFIWPVDYKSWFIDNDSSKNTKAHLRINPEEIYRDPQKVNALLEEQNITNVRIITKEEFQEQFSKLLDKAKVLKVNI